MVADPTSERAEIHRAAHHMAEGRRPATNGCKGRDRRRLHSHSLIHRQASPPGSSRNFAPGPIAVVTWSRFSRRTTFWQTSASIGLRARLALHSGHTTPACTDPWPGPDNAKIAVPTGYTEFPCEILRPPRSLASRTYSDIRRWTVMPRGGHFAAMEQPEALTSEIREFFRPLRRE